MKRFGAISGLRARLFPMNKLRLVAPTNVLDAPFRVTTALTTTALYTTDPLAQQVAGSRARVRCFYWPEEHNDSGQYA
jgi:hypothetical protein